MKKIIFEVSDEMFLKIDRAAVREGFMSRSEFLRFLLVTYFKEKEGIGRDFGASKSESDSIPDDASGELDLEFGIPVNVIRKIEAVAKKMDENKPQPRS